MYRGGSASQFDIKEKAVRAAGKKTVRLLPPATRERAATTFMGSTNMLVTCIHEIVAQTEHMTCCC